MREASLLPLVLSLTDFPSLLPGRPSRRGEIVVDATTALHHALINDNISESSPKCQGPDFELELDYKRVNPGDFSPTNSGYEERLFLLQMKAPGSGDEDKTSYTARVARAGNIYSFVNADGNEVMAPQGWEDSPFNDEVWQFVTVDGVKHNPDGGDNMMVHQSGSYLRPHEEPLLTEPWTAPDICPNPMEDFSGHPLQNVNCQGNTCAFASWSQQSDLPTPFKANVLTFQRYRNCGNGVMEHISAIHNMEGNPDPGTDEFNNDMLSFLSTPWVGVRPSLLSDVIETNVRNEMSIAEHSPSWTFHKNVALKDTAGFLTFSEEVCARNPNYDMPCADRRSQTGNDDVDCGDRKNADRIQYTLMPMDGYGGENLQPCGRAQWAMDQLDLPNAIQCRIEPTGHLRQSTFEDGNPKYLQLVADDPLVLQENGQTSIEDSFTVLDLHPFHGVINFSRIVGDKYYIVFTPRNLKLTHNHINRMFSVGSKLSITETPEFQLPCGDKFKEEVSCDSPQSIGQLKLDLIPWSPGSPYACIPNPGLTRLYEHDVVQCRLRHTVSVQHNGNTKYSAFTLMSKTSGNLVNLNVQGVLHWSYRSEDKGHLFIFFAGDGGAAIAQERLVPGDRLEVYQNVQGGSWHHNMALTFVLGTPQTLNESMGGRRAGSIPIRQDTTYRYGMAGSPKRDFMAVEVSSFLNVAVGESYSKRQYIITDKLKEMKSKSLEWVQETQQLQLAADETFHSGHTVHLYAAGDSSPTFGACLSTEECGAQHNVVCVGRTVPGGARYATFAIQCGTEFYVGTDRYHFQPDLEDDKYRPYICANSPGHTPKYTFLGFFQSGACGALGGMQYDPELC